MTTFMRVILIWAVAWAAHANTQQATYVADNSTTIGHYTIQYTTFNSLMIQPDIASIHQLVRAKDQALVNVSIIDNRKGETVAAEVSGTAKNLIQQSKTLPFKTIEEPGAVYYIAALRHTNEELFHFTVDLVIDGDPYQVKFTRKLYIEN